MLDFLADNYIWFFVASGILLLALIGFIVGNKKKAKAKEFKGESVPESVTTAVPSEPVKEEMVINDIPTEEPKKVEEEPKMEPLNEISNVPEEKVNNELGSMPVHELKREEVEPVETMKINEPVIPTAPESFYDEPLMGEVKEPETISFEIDDKQ